LLHLRPVPAERLRDPLRHIGREVVRRMGCYL
jgi:hypothetical protein